MVVGSFPSGSCSFKCLLEALKLLLYEAGDGRRRRRPRAEETPWRVVMEGWLGVSTLCKESSHGVGRSRSFGRHGQIIKVLVGLRVNMVWDASKS